MYNLYEYTRTRLFVTQFQREQFVSMIVKKMLKSMARSTGNRVHNNKWMRLLDHLFAGHPGQGEALFDELRERLSSYEQTHQQSCLRISYMMEIIHAHRTSNQLQTDLQSIVRTFDPLFEKQNQSEWIELTLPKLNMLRASGCGHVTTSRGLRVVRGNSETVDEMNYVCSHCANEMLDSGKRIKNFYDELILPEFAVAVRGASRDYTQDRRISGISYDVRRMIWHDASWSPYANLINSYHSSRSVGFRLIESPWFQSHRRAFGCELEVQVRTGDANAAAGRVHDVLNPSGNVGEYCFFERDGSIGTGFEIVTQPAGLDVHKEKFALFLQNSELKRGLRSHEGGNCGFHVHVGREYVTQSQIYRIQSFINDVRNEALIRSIARRYESGYCKYKPVMAKFTPHGKNTGDRYEALNVNNSETIEFRIFRGSLRYESVAAALEFVNAVLTFCTPGVTSIMDFNAIGFKRWLMRPENRPDTKYLRSYLHLDVNSDNERQAA